MVGQKEHEKVIVAVTTIEFLMQRIYKKLVTEQSTQNVKYDENDNLVENEGYQINEGAVFEK